MKFNVIFIIIILLLLNVTDLFPASEKWSPEKIAITGGIFVGIELIYNLINMFSEKEKDSHDIFIVENTNERKRLEMEELEKYEELERLVAPSRLFALIEESNAEMDTNVATTVDDKLKAEEEQKELELLMAEIVRPAEPKSKRRGFIDEETVEMAKTFTYEEPEVTKQITNLAPVLPEEITDTNRPTDIVTNVAIIEDKAPHDENSVTNTNRKEQLEVNPFEAQFEFQYISTNRATGEVKVEKKVDYYQIGVAYHSLGKEDEAKDYFIQTIAMDKSRLNRARAIRFLKINYNMNLDVIIDETKKFKLNQK